MKVFITGIAGFMGSHLSHYLSKQGHIVSGIDNYFHPCELTPLTCVRGDIRNRALVEEMIKDSDVVLHLAAQIHVDYSIKYPQETLDINVSGTLNILEAARKYKKRVIIASTSEAYGTSQTGYMDENHPLDCQSPYGASKVAADRLAKSYIDTYGMDIVIARNFNAFGPYQNDGSYGSVIAIFTKAALSNSPIYINGDGSAERDYMYIDDICRVYSFLLSHGKPGVYNFGTGQSWTIKDIAQKIKWLAESTSEIIHREPRAGEVQKLLCDCSKLKRLGINPETDFDRELAKYVEWYSKRIGV